MNKPRDVAVIVGSLRKDSLNRKLANVLAQIAPGSLNLNEVEIGHLRSTTKIVTTRRLLYGLPFVSALGLQMRFSSSRRSTTGRWRPHWSGRQRFARRHRRVRC